MNNTILIKNMTLSVKKQLIRLLRDLNYSYDELHSDADIELVYDMFKNDKPIDINDNNIDNYDSSVITYLGFYYSTKNDLDNMMKYYHIAIGKNNPDAMINIGYAFKRENDFDNMMKYYLMAVEQGDSDGLVCIGNYYEQENDHDNAKKYYMMATEKGNISAHKYLAHHYTYDNDYENALNHHMIVYNDPEYDPNDDTNNDCPFFIGYCYYNMQKYELMEKYLLIYLDHHVVLNHNQDDNRYIVLSFNMLDDHYKNNVSDEYIKYLTEFIFKNNEYNLSFTSIFNDTNMRSKFMSYMKSRPAPSNVYENECPLCLNNVIDEKIILKCGHVYCEQCLSDFISNNGNNNTKCCICKSPVC